MRIGAVSYLNTKPLVYGLEELAPQHELVFDLPSRLADRLAAGDLDVALIPSVEFFQNPDYTIVSDACIGCRGPVLSVKLLSRVPLPEIRTLALDEGSRTSVALVRILLKEQYGIEPRRLPLPIDAPYEDAPADAVLVIGDRAIHPARGQWMAQWDLGEEWNRWAGLPFVFAMWVGKGSGLRVQDTGSRVHKRSAMHPFPDKACEEFADLGAVLAHARDLGVANIERIARAEHERYGLSYDECRTYLRDHLHFTLGVRERAGLELFRTRAETMRLVPVALDGSLNESRPVGVDHPFTFSNPGLRPGLS